MADLRSIRSLVFMVALLALVAAAGCAGPHLKNLADRDSLTRLEALPEDASVLVSLHGATLPESIARSKLLGSRGHARLLVASRRDLDSLAAMDGLRRVIVWGDADLVETIDPLLRLDLLEALDSVAGEGAADPEIAAIAVFRPDLTMTPDDLRALGIAVGSMNGPVVTATGTASALLDLAAHPELVRLRQSTPQFPTTNSGRLEP